MRTFVNVVLAGTATLALVTGCSDGDAAQPGSTGTAGAAPLPNPPGSVRIAVTQTALGETVTIDGWTVYRFEADSDKPPASICENDCLRAWPPVLSDGSRPEVTGIDPALVGTFVRVDGTDQVTVRGWPLYRFVDDVAPGETVGEGVGGNWSALGKDGRPLVAK